MPGRRSSLAAAAIAVLTLPIAGCGSDIGTQAGFGLAELSPDDIEQVLDAAGTEATSMSGELVVRRNGCFAWSGEGQEDGAWIVWPDSAGLDEGDGSRVVLPGGEVVTDGSAVVVTAAAVGLDQLPGGANPDSYFGSFGRYCEADARGVLVVVDAAVR